MEHAQFVERICKAQIPPLQSLMLT